MQRAASTLSCNSQQLLRLCLCSWSGHRAVPAIRRAGQDLGPPSVVDTLGSPGEHGTAPEFLPK
jgi:hypothetical protein